VDREKAKLLERKVPIGGWSRLVSINSVLSSLPIFMLSFFEVSKGVLEKIDYFRSRFFWQSDSQKKKYRLTKWNIVCQPKDQGGLGIQNLEIQNQCLLSKWLFKLINEEGEISILIHHWESREKTRGFTFLVWINESQRSLPQAWIISFAKHKTNPVSERQMTR
jgi:hypothetical protein